LSAITDGLKDGKGNINRAKKDNYSLIIDLKTESNGIFANFNVMKHRRLWIFTGILLIFTFFIRIYSFNETRVENGYSLTFYPSLASLLRSLFGWLPFSIGDVLYAIFIFWVGRKALLGIYILYIKKATWRGFFVRCLKLLAATLLFYVLFNGLWGINYNRKGIASQLELKMDTLYSVAELKQINALLLQKVNAAKQGIINTNYPSSKELFVQVQQAYAVIDSSYPFLKYRKRSIKSSLWGWLGNYVGFTGYYNPFTGEAQVNTSVPKFVQPFTACHEVAHQLGYAKENEANFVGYLAAKASPDKRFQYSVYLDLFLYSNRNLYNSDTISANTYDDQLLPSIKNDLNELRLFYQRHKNPIEPAIRWLYGKFLEGNEQPDGILTYDQVTGFLIAYYKKFGDI
jgi:hypothetical protein